MEKMISVEPKVGFGTAMFVVMVASATSLGVGMFYLIPNDGGKIFGIQIDSISTMWICVGIFAVIAASISLLMGLHKEENWKWHSVEVKE